MANKIKFCNSCNSVKAEQFVFCPSCGTALEEFVQSTEAASGAESISSDSIETISSSDAVTEMPSNGNETIHLPQVADVTDIEEEGADYGEQSGEQMVRPAADAVAVSTETASTDNQFSPSSSSGGLSLTIVDERPSKTTNRLMLVAAILLISFAVGAWFVSLFGIANETSFLDGELVVAAQILEDDILTKLEEEERKPARNKGDKEGGGGGGREESTPPSKGRLVTQSPKPLFPPSPNFEQAKTSLPIVQSTEGDTERPITNQRAGIPTSLSEDPSSGPGRGGGIGTGIGPSQGAGVGTSLGNRRGLGGCPDPPCGGDDDAPAIRRGETVAVKILSQPRASYTDAARQAGVQGKVVLRVTFQADGSIGAVSAVSGLPNGLTERAIAAARSIRFEPAKRNGVPYSVTRTIEYSFTIY